MILTLKKVLKEFFCVKALRFIGRLTPNIKYIRALPNYILFPLHKLTGCEGCVVNVLGNKMLLNPKETVDRELWFIPHLYDRKEINFLKEKLTDDSVFLDIGSNIGFWSLFFAKANNKTKIVAIEANPQTYEKLIKNIEINKYGNIIAINKGVADMKGELPLYLNEYGNHGGDSLSSNLSKARNSILVPVDTLYDILLDLNISKINIMKMDIEGYELITMRHFFKYAPISYWPEYLCLEKTLSDNIDNFFSDYSYKCILNSRENMVFRKII